MITYNTVNILYFTQCNDYLSKNVLLIFQHFFLTLNHSSYIYVLLYCTITFICVLYIIYYTKQKYLLLLIDKNKLNTKKSLILQVGNLPFKIWNMLSSSVNVSK